MEHGGGFQGRGDYETYSRRDFMTNQGDFSDEFGGGPEYGYEGMNRGGMSRRPMGRYGSDYGPYGGMGGMHGGMGMGGGRGMGGGVRGSSYGGISGYDRPYRGMERGQRYGGMSGYDAPFRDF